MPFPSSPLGPPVTQPPAASVDWNRRSVLTRPLPGPVRTYDETLRDGIQGPSVVDPDLAAKRDLVDRAAAIGIDAIDLGLPGAGPRAVADVTALAEHIRDNHLAIRPSCAARTLEADIRPVVEISQRVGVRLEVMAFLGASPIRQLVEDWGLDKLIRLARSAVRFGVDHGLPVTFVTEDTIRASPAVLEPLLLSAVDEGAQRLCLCDTVGHGTHDGVKALVHFTRDMLERRGLEVGIDWHGHNDRGLALGNSLAAVEAGADRIHGTALGVGERVGNTPLDLLLLHLSQAGIVDIDPNEVEPWCRAVSDAFKWPLPARFPLHTQTWREAFGGHT